MPHRSERSNAVSQAFEVTSGLPVARGLSGNPFSAFLTRRDKGTTSYFGAHGSYVPTCQM
jgi:hypothetical protein